MAKSDLLEAVQTKASLLAKSKATEYKATVFESQKPKLKKPNSELWAHTKQIKTNFDKSNEEDDFSDGQTEMHRRRKIKRDDTEFDIKRARHEVINFAISGSESKDKKAAQIALAIKLGAKPPKRQYKNYKELLQEKEVKKREEDNEQKLLLLGKNQYGAAATKCNKKKKSIVSQIGKNYGVVNPKFKKRK